MARSRLAAKPHGVSHPAAGRYRLNVLDLGDELNVHTPS